MYVCMCGFVWVSLSKKNLSLNLEEKSMHGSKDKKEVRERSGKEKREDSRHVYSTEDSKGPHWIRSNGERWVQVSIPNR